MSDDEPSSDGRRLARAVDFLDLAVAEEASLSPEDSPSEPLPLPEPEPDPEPLPLPLPLLLPLPLCSDADSGSDSDSTDGSLCSSLDIVPCCALLCPRSYSAREAKDAAQLPSG